MNTEHQTICKSLYSGEQYIQVDKVLRNKNAKMEVCGLK
jgi:hypothetical protein